MINVYPKSINPTQLLINNSHQDFLKFVWKESETMKKKIVLANNIHSELGRNVMKTTKLDTNFFGAGYI